MCQSLFSQKSLVQPSPGLFFLCVRDVIHCDAESRENHTLMSSFMRLPGRVLYSFKNLRPSTLLLLRPPPVLFSVILPDYYSRGQSGIHTDPWHWRWIVGFLRRLLVYVCVCKTDLERASETFFLVFVCGSSSAKPCQLRCGRNAHSYFSKRTFPKERTVFLNFWAEAPEMEGAKPCLASAGKQEDKRTSQTYSQ